MDKFCYKENVKLTCLLYQICHLHLTILPGKSLMMRNNIITRNSQWFEALVLVFEKFGIWHAKRWPPLLSWKQMFTYCNINIRQSKICLQPVNSLLYVKS